MRGTPEQRKRRFAAIRKKMMRRPSGIAAVREVDHDSGSNIEPGLAAVREVDHDSGSSIETVLLDGSSRPATPAERAWWAAGEPTWYFAITTDGRVIDTGGSDRRAARKTREHRSPSKSRTISRRARTSATSTADPSSSRPRGGNRPLRSVRIETTRLALRLALLVIGGSR